MPTVFQVGKVFQVVHQVGAGAYLIKNCHILSHGNNDFDDKVRGLAHLEIKTSSK